MAWRYLGCGLSFFSSASQVVAGEFSDSDSSAKQGLISNRQSPWSASIGFGARRMGRLSYDGFSQSTTGALPSFFTADATNDPLIGELGVNGDRTYNNGFVNQSALTGATGLTTFWGYDNAGQVNGDELSFSANGSRTNTLGLLSNNDRLSYSDNLNSAVGQVDFTYELPERVLGMKALVLSFSYSASDSGFSGSNFSGSQGQETYNRNFTDTYALGEVALNVPPSGFRGTFAGPNAAIPNQPEGRAITETLASTDVTSFGNSVSSSADLSAFGINFGPVFDGRIDDRFYWEAAAGVSLTIFDWETRQQETLSATTSTGVTQQMASFTNGDTGTDIGIGLFARASLFYELNDQWFLKSQLQGDVGNSFDLGSGASAFNFEPSGYSLLFGAGMNF